MGDRGNIQIHLYDEEPDVFFYTHWRGSSIADVVKRALKKRCRWNDPSYLSRIIFDVLTETDHGQTTGFGISTVLEDNEHDIVMVNVPKQTVSIGSETWTFEEFIQRKTNGY